MTGIRRQKQPRFRGPRKPYESTKRQEIMDLQRQAKVLAKQIEQAKSRAPLFKNMTRWERLARSEKCLVRKILLEKHRLLDMVKLNNAFITNLKAQINKKKQLQEPVPCNWENHKLEAQESVRDAAIRAIADSQFERKSMEYINAGLIDETRDLFRLRGFQCTMTSQAMIPVPCAVVSKALWQMYSGNKFEFMSDTSQIHERLDANTVYERFTETRQGITVHANTVRKVYVTDEEHVVVVRSVLEDELSPQLSTGVLEEQSAWITIVRLDEATCRVTVDRKLNFQSRRDVSDM
ncbi:hypothetical protein LEN26_007926, partial [Aphanomyces euteiches]